MSRTPSSLAALFGLVLAACGGGGGDPGGRAPVPAPPPPPVTDAQRIAAATATAQSNALCTAVRPFYWEVGNKGSAMASGSVGGTTFTATTAMPYASSSKWIYGAYAVQRANGAPSATDIRFLTFRSGYTGMNPLSCGVAATVDACLLLGTNGAYNAVDDGRFFYNGGHMQRHAHDLGFGGFTNADLTAEVASKIGSFGFAYTEPQPAGGLSGTPNQYAAFLRAMLSGTLALRDQLGSNAVCTNPATCPTAAFTPIPSNESWHYSLGHWVEDDPTVGDGAFSSAGLFGFYPWIDSSKTWYGVLARHDFAQGAGYDSAQCGRLIRKAWVTGVTQ